MMPKIMKRFLIGLGVMLAGAATYKLTASQAVPTADMVIESANVSDQDKTTAPQPAPELELKDMTGKVVRLSDYRGQVVVLNFWATWCPPCRKEIPDFIELQNNFGPQGLQFIGVAMDEEGAPKIQQYLDKQPINYPIWVGEAGPVQEKFGALNAIPVTYIIDRKGNIRAKYVGIRKKAVVEEMIRPLLSEK